MLKQLLHTAIDSEAAWNPSWKRSFTGERAVSSGSWIKFNFFATRMSENQSDRFFSMLEHATVSVRATKFAEVETGLNRAMICINVSNFFTYFQKIGRSKWTQRSKFGRLIPHFGGLWPLGSAVILSSVTAWCGTNNKQSVCVIRNKYVK